jgi:hypothetical protein
MMAQRNVFEVERHTMFKRYQDWFPLFLLLCVPAMMGMDGGEILPGIYIVTNALGGWLGARNGVRSMREDFTKHVNDVTVHIAPK